MFCSCNDLLNPLVRPCRRGGRLNDLSHGAFLADPLMRCELDWLMKERRGRQVPLTGKWNPPRMFSGRSAPRSAQALPSMTSSRRVRRAGARNLFLQNLMATPHPAGQSGPCGQGGGSLLHPLPIPCVSHADHDQSSLHQGGWASREAWHATHTSVLALAALWGMPWLRTSRRGKALLMKPSPSMQCAARHGAVGCAWRCASLAQCAPLLERSDPAASFDSMLT